MSLPKELARTDATAGERRKLLILANDRALRRELERIFADLEVVASDASEQTLAVVRRMEPDVVLFDLGADGTTGANTAGAGAAGVAANLDLLRQILNLAPTPRSSP